MQILAVGKSSFVSRNPDSKSTVVKQIFPGFDAELEFERHVYEWLGTHPRIANFHGPTDQGIELQYYPQSSLDNFRKTQQDVPYLKWSEQIAEGLAYIHSRGLIHCDLRPANVLVTESQDVVLTDFGSSMLDGVKVSDIMNHHRYRPADFEEPNYFITVKDDLFAFGTLAYYLTTGKEPYEEKANEEIIELYANGIFPLVSGLEMGRIMLKCWMGGYSSATEVLEDIRQYI